MKTGLISSFQDFQKILVLCPRCGGIHRLSEMKLSYRGKLRRTWWDSLLEREAEVEKAAQRLDEQRASIREKAREKGRKQLPRLLKKCVPTICAHGYYPQDVKALFDPIDFVIFDGMNQKQEVKKVVLFDGPAADKRRETAQNSIQRVLKKGNYGWRTVKLDEKGHVRP